MQSRQGGIILCRAAANQPFSIIHEDHVMARSEPELKHSGERVELAILGLHRDAPTRLELETRYASGRGPVTRHTVQIAARHDPIREIGNMNCDQISARTEAQKAHIERSWLLKQQAFAHFAPAAKDSFSFQAPTPGRFSSPFGPLRHYTGRSEETGKLCKKTSVHRGLDIATPIGTALRAPMAGRVILADPDLYYEGGCVFLDHGRGLVSVFMHLDTIMVQPGQSVKRGEPLGTTGNTGRSSGPHLHWGVKWRNMTEPEDRSGDFYIDPALLPGVSETLGGSE